MSYEDFEAVMRLVEDEEEKERLYQIANELDKRTMRGNQTAHWWLPLSSISYIGFEEPSEGNQGGF
jgi:hypothetical protein